LSQVVEITIGAAGAAGEAGEALGDPPLSWADASGTGAVSPGDSELERVETGEDEFPHEATTP